MIKMKDAFKGEVYANNLNLDAVIVGSDVSLREYAAVAINAYDTNQQEIANLKRLVDFDTRAILEDCETIDSQKLEITEVKAMTNALLEGLSSLVVRLPKGVTGYNSLSCSDRVTAHKLTLIIHKLRGQVK